METSTNSHVGRRAPRGSPLSSFFLRIIKAAVLCFLLLPSNWSLYQLQSSKPTWCPPLLLPLQWWNSLSPVKICSFSHLSAFLYLCGSLFPLSPHTLWLFPVFCEWMSSFSLIRWHLLFSVNICLLAAPSPQPIMSSSRMDPLIPKTPYTCLFYP